jgi:transposase
MLAAQSEGVKAKILENDWRIIASARTTEVVRRLLEAGIGPVLASAFVASVANPAIFKSGRDLAAWIGLVPRQNSSGGKERLGGITKAGNGYLRQMLMVRAMDRRRPTYTPAPGSCSSWAAVQRRLRVSRSPTRPPRTVWALMTSGERYRDPRAIRAAGSATA